MRVLAVSDKVEPVLYSPGLPDRVGKIDCVLSCGDLPFYYIEYLTTVISKPTYFVYGNHAREVQFTSGKGEEWNRSTAPMGASDLHRRGVKEGPLLLAGLEGSMRYNDGPGAQYTDGEMWSNVRRLAPRLLYNRIRYGRYLDVLVAHSPPYGIHDKQDLPHIGFRSFLPFMRWFRPRYLLHGHIHIYRNDEITETLYYHTRVINVYPYKILELDPWPLMPRRLATPPLRSATPSEELE